MSKATIVCVCIIAAVVAACATGGSDSGNNGATDAAVSRQDASSVSTPDAPGADAGAADAQVSQLPDAGGGSGSGSGSGSGGGLFCTTNSQCTVAGECCVTLGGPNGFCAPGTVVLGQCVPQ